MAGDVLGVLRVCSGDYSLTDFEASRFFNNQEVCYLITSADKTDYQLQGVGATPSKGPHGGLLVWELPWSPSSALTLALRGQSPAPLSEPWAEARAPKSWTTSKAHRTPHSGLLGWLAGSLPVSRRLLGAARDSCCRLAPTGFCAREGGVFPCGFDGGAVRSPQGSHTTVEGRGQTKDCSRTLPLQGLG